MQNKHFLFDLVINFLLNLHFFFYGKKVYSTYITFLKGVFGYICVRKSKKF